MGLNLTEAELDRLVHVSHALHADTLPDRWLDVLPGVTGNLQRLFHADFLGTTRWNARRQRFDEAMCVGRDVTMARDYEDEFQFCDPISARVQSRGGPTLIRQVISRATLNRSRYFNEFLRPYDTVDGLDLHVMDNGREIGDLRIWRSHSAPPFGAREVNLLRLLEPAFAAAFRRRRMPTPALLRERFPAITAREADVAAAVAAGHDDRGIAHRLGCSVWTVRTHLSHLFGKLGVTNRTELAATLHSPDRQIGRR